MPPATRPRSYPALLRAFPLRPIRSERQLDRAVRVVDALIDCSTLTRDEQDYLDVLSLLIEAYESAAHPLAPLYDGAMLRHLLEAKGVRQGRFAADTGLGPTTVSLVLSGRRRLTRAQVERVARYFGVSPAVFLGD